MMNICVDIQAKGFLNRKKFLHISGTFILRIRSGRSRRLPNDTLEMLTKSLTT